jgi:hypothetical protein
MSEPQLFAALAAAVLAFLLMGWVTLQPRNPR